MPRPKSDNHKGALNQVMLLFWQQGFEATSMRDIETHTRLSAGSLYHEFGSKKQIFIRALENYLEQIIRFRIDTYLLQNDNPREGILKFFTSTIAKPASLKSHPSCLLVNTALEMGQTDKDIHRVIQTGFSTIQQALTLAIQRSLETGDTNSSINPTQSAKQLAMLLPGVLLSAKNGILETELEKLVASSLELLLPRPSKQ